MAAVRSVAELVCSAVAVAGGLLLLWAGLGHARAFDRLRATLLVHGLLPGRGRRAGAVALVVAEVGVGGAVVGGALSSLRTTSALPSRLVLPAMVGEAVVYTGFLTYLTALRRTRPDAPCGCLRGDGPLRLPVLVRAGGFAVAAAVAASLSTGPTPFVESLTGTGRLASVSVLVPALVLAVLTALVPASFRTTQAVLAHPSTPATAPAKHRCAQPSSPTTSFRRN
ncbi:MauE/DoxX family redox-associated membrane protein [Actinopolymorpha sp. NPDC004070]|uniref:MauE/DoxX family redox-associated membrane protein n=1 Tax=Actinopolymorpha sp. NPDC004070 TaxID=3154548 RepID=UPI00339EDF53